MSNSWSVPTSPDVVARRAGGRRHYNLRRQTLALIRRTEVCRLLDRFPLDERGTVVGIARVLGVSAATICRDLNAMYPFRQHCHAARPGYIRKMREQLDKLIS